MISNDPLCNSVNRGLTLVRLSQAHALKLTFQKTKIKDGALEKNVDYQFEFPRQ